MPVDPLENFINNRREEFDHELPGNLWERIDADLSPETDDFEEFISGNRADFDADEPPIGLWNRILAALPAQVDNTPVIALQSRRRTSFLLRIAAAAAVVLVAGALFLGRQMGYQDAQSQQLALINEIDPEFLDTEQYYEYEIQQTFRVVSERIEDPELYQDLEAIDQAMAELKEEILTVPREEQADLIADLIMSYQIKLQILQKVLQHLPDNDPAMDTSKSEPSIEL
ncbi:MAG: hypothetical protein AAF828_10710 [Bacteroidota bacterium]